MFDYLKNYFLYVFRHFIGWFRSRHLNLIITGHTPIETVVIYVGSQDLYYGGTFEKYPCLKMGFTRPSPVPHDVQDVFSTLNSAQHISLFIKVTKALLFGGDFTDRKYTNSSFPSVTRVEHSQYLIMHASIAELVRRHREIRRIIVPFEGRMWERAIFEVCRQKGVDSIAYTHTLLTNIARLNYEQFAIRYRPTVVLTCGSFNDRVLRLAGWPSTLVRRFFYLRQFSAPFLRRPGSDLLIFLSGNLESDSELLEILRTSYEKFKRQASSMRVFVYPHPRVSSKMKISLLIRQLGFEVPSHVSSVSPCMILSSSIMKYVELTGREFPLLYLSRSNHTGVLEGINWIDFSQIPEILEGLLVNRKIYRECRTVDIHDFIDIPTQKIRGEDFFSFADMKNF